MKTEDRPAPTAPTDNGVVQQSGSAGERAEEPNTPDRTLVVGVDGSAESLAAAHYAVAAADDARR